MDLPHPEQPSPRHGLGGVLWGRSRATPVTAVVLVVWVESGFPDRLPARRLSLSLHATSSDRFDTLI